MCQRSEGDEFDLKDLDTPQSFMEECQKDGEKATRVCQEVWRRLSTHVGIKGSLV